MDILGPVRKLHYQQKKRDGNGKVESHRNVVQGCYHGKLQASHERHEGPVVKSWHCLFLNILFLGFSPHLNVYAVGFIYKHFCKKNLKTGSMDSQSLDPHNLLRKHGFIFNPNIKAWFGRVNYVEHNYRSRFWNLFNRSEKIKILIFEQGGQWKLYIFEFYEEVLLGNEWHKKDNPHFFFSDEHPNRCVIKFDPKYYEYYYFKYSNPILQDLLQTFDINHVVHTLNHEKHLQSLNNY